MDVVSLNHWIEQAAVEVQSLVDKEFERVGTPETGSALDQFGLVNGIEVIRDYLRANEAGVAFDHLLYMILELDLVVPTPTFDVVVRAAKAMGYDPVAWACVRHMPTDAGR